MTTSRRLTAGSAGVLVACLAGCGEKTIDGDKVERFVSGQAVEATGVTPEDVSCPADRTAKAGDVFACRVTGHDGTSLTVRMRQVDDDGRVKTITQRVVNTRRVERGVTDTLLQKRNVKAQVHCPEYTVYVKGDTLDCAARAGNDRGTARLTFTDDAGGYSVALVAP